MPDISMCANDVCPMRKSCRRNPDSGTEPHARQSWMMFRFVMDLDGELICGDYWPVAERLEAHDEGR